MRFFIMKPKCEIKVIAVVGDPDFRIFGGCVAFIRPYLYKIGDGRYVLPNLIIQKAVYFRGLFRENGGGFICWFLSDGLSLPEQWKGHEQQKKCAKWGR